LPSGGRKSSNSRKEGKKRFNHIRLGTAEKGGGMHKFCTLLGGRIDDEKEGEPRIEQVKHRGKRKTEGEKESETRAPLRGYDLRPPICRNEGKREA